MNKKIVPLSLVQTDNGLLETHPKSGSHHIKRRVESLEGLSRPLYASGNSLPTGQAGGQTAASFFTFRYTSGLSYKK